MSAPHNGRKSGLRGFGQPPGVSGQSRPPPHPPIPPNKSTLPPPADPAPGRGSPQRCMLLPPPNAPCSGSAALLLRAAEGRRAAAQLAGAQYRTGSGRPLPPSLAARLPSTPTPLQRPGHNGSTHRLLRQQAVATRGFQVISETLRKVYSLDKDRGRGERREKVVKKVR